MRPYRFFDSRITCRSAATAMASVFAGLALVSCSTSSPVHLHSLVPVGTPERTAKASAAPAISVVLEPLRIPAQVDQPQWLIRMPDDSVARLEQERWASPLRDELRLALLEWFIDRHGLVEARSPSIGAPPVRVAVEVRRFESVPGREARLEGAWTLTRSAPGVGPLPAASCEWLIREGAGVGYPALAGAQRHAVERLADQLAGAIVGYADGRTPACPAADAPRGAAN